MTDIAAGLNTGRMENVGYTSNALYATTGEKLYFETLTSAGVKPEGEHCVCYPTPFEAANDFQRALTLYLATKPGAIYWRERPYLFSQQNPKTNTIEFCVISRLLVDEGPLSETAWVAEPAPATPSKPSIIEKLVTTTAQALNIYEAALTPAAPATPAAPVIEPSPTKPMDRKEGWRARKGPQAWNTSGFRATGHRILLKTDPVETVSEGGIVLVSKTVQAEKNLAVVCTIVEIGFDCWSDKCTDYADAGDRVLVGQYTGKFHTSEKDGEEYRFVVDTDIITPIES